MDTAVFADDAYPGRHHHSVLEIPSGSPYELTLHRVRCSRLTYGAPGSLDVARVAPEDLAEPRIERLRGALETKCPKLKRC